jgi:hypothetical protein
MPKNQVFGSGFFAILKGGGKMRKWMGCLMIVTLLAPQYSAAELVGDGLTGHYYKGYKKNANGHIVFTGLTKALSRIDPNVDFWNRSSRYRFEPVPGWGDNYSVLWKGYLYITKAGSYGFGTISDDGSQIWIDGNLIVDNGESQWFDWEDNISEGIPADSPYSPLQLAAGFHEISVAFFENKSYDGIELWWLKPDAGVSDIPYYGTTFHGSPPTYNPNTNWEIVPQKHLFTEHLYDVSYVISAMQALAQMASFTDISEMRDANGDGAIGFEDLLIALQFLSGVRDVAP